MRVPGRDMASGHRTKAIRPAGRRAPRALDVWMGEDHSSVGLPPASAGTTAEQRV